MTTIPGSRVGQNDGRPAVVPCVGRDFSQRPIPGINASQSALSDHRFSPVEADLLSQEEIHRIAAALRPRGEFVRRWFVVVLLFLNLLAVGSLFWLCLKPILVYVPVPVRSSLATALSLQEAAE